MKKNIKNMFLGLLYPKKSLYFLYVAIFLLSGSALNSYATGQQQNIDFTFNVKNGTLKEVMHRITDLSGYTFTYEDSRLNLNDRMDISVSNKSLKETLDVVFAKRGIPYTIKDKIIVLNLKSQNKGSEADSDRVWTIQGQVLDRSEPPFPMPGVNIMIKGSSSGTVSDQNGYFSLKAKKGDILIFSFLGYKNYEYVVTRAINNLSVSLIEDVEALEEVVVTGFSEEKKLNSISSVSSLNVKSNLVTKPITSLSQALQGGITGLTVTQNSGLPGADAAVIKIRGISTLGKSDPLVLVDGIPMDMNNLDPNTIESVTILKDAAAASIYGARAANGVIVVKTKRGLPGKVNVSYNGYFGIQNATYLPEFIDAAGYMEMVNAANLNIGGDIIYKEDAINKTRSGEDPVNYPNTNWADFIFKTGSVQSHSVSISGGSNLARFALTANYLKNEGLVSKANSDRLNIRANTSVNLLDNLSVNMDFNSYRTNRQEPMYREDSYTSSIIGYMYGTPPNTVARYPQKEGSDIVYYGNRPEQRNPAILLDRGGRYKVLEDNVSINISPRWEVLPRLILKGQYSYRVSSGASNQKRASYNFFDYQTNALLATWNSINKASKDRSSYYYLGATAEYTWEYKKHRLFAVGGYNQELTNNGDWDQWAMRSLFAKANYTFDRRYLLEATVRHDGSSRFGKGHKYGVFPSIAGGWNLHEEAFMKQVKFINEMKLRINYGLLGNENIDLYKYQTLIDSSNGNETTYGNPDITWETVHMLNAGIDLRVFKDFNISFDYYNKLTSDIIITPPISDIGGIGVSPLNAGEVRNRGWELDVNYNKQFRDFGFNIHGGLSQNKNEIESLFGGPYDNNDHIHKEGYALNSFYVYPTDGLLQESDFNKDSNGKWVPKEGVVIFDGQQPGDIKYLDVSGLDGKPDGKITTNDRVVRGDGEPQFNYFANISMKYKKIDFEILFQGVQGVDAYYSEPYSFGLDMAGDGQTPLAVQADYWTPTNTDARYPRMAPNSTYGNNGKMSDFWYFDASYCRVKYIQVGYTFDQIGLKKIGISGIRVYVNTQNPFTISKEKLVDPESRGQKSSYPLVKTYSMGVSLNF